MQFPLKLERECQFIARCGNKGTEYELQAVVVHQGDSKKGHYITFLKPAGGPHWALFDDDTVKWVQEKEVLGQEATILVYTRPDGVVETEAIIIPDDGHKDRSHREMDDSGSVPATIVIPDDEPEGRSHREMDDAGSVTATTGNNTLGKAVRESADTRQSSTRVGRHSAYAPGDILEVGGHSLYQELLERALQDPGTEESDLEKVMMPGPSSKNQKLQDEARQGQETRVFRDYLQEHELREEEVETFGNCLFLSIDEESPDSGGNEQGSNSEPIATSVIGDEEGARSHDHRHNHGATEEAAATMPLAASTTMDIDRPCPLA
jgi:hypothetical protein